MTQDNGSGKKGPGSRYVDVSPSAPERQPITIWFGLGLQAIAILATLGLIGWNAYAHLDTKISESRRETFGQIEQFRREAQEGFDRLSARIDGLVAAIYRSDRVHSHPAPQTPDS